MPLEGEYEPSPQQWVRDQVEHYEATGGREANTLRDTGLPVAIFSDPRGEERQGAQAAADAGRARRRLRDGGVVRAARPRTRPGWPTSGRPPTR